MDELALRKRILLYLKAEALAVARLAVPGQSSAEYMRSYSRTYAWGARQLERGRPLAEVIRLARLLADQKGTLSEALKGERMGYSQLAYELTRAQVHPELLEMWTRASQLEVAELLAPTTEDTAARQAQRSMVY